MRPRVTSLELIQVLLTSFLLFSSYVGHTRRMCSSAILPVSRVPHANQTDFGLVEKVARQSVMTGAEPRNDRFLLSPELVAGVSIQCVILPIYFCMLLLP